MVGRTLAAGRAVQVLDVQTEPDFKMVDAARLSRVHTMLGVPLLRGGPAGRRHRVAAPAASRPFTDKQIELVTTFADQAVIAIENVRLFDDVQPAHATISANRWSSRPRPAKC